MKKKKKKNFKPIFYSKTNSRTNSGKLRAKPWENDKEGKK